MAAQNFIIYVNEFALNESGSSFYLDDPIDGLTDIPDIRTSQYNKSGMDGGSVSSQYYGMREIAFQGHIFDRDPVALETKRKALIAAIAGKQFELRVVTYSGASYRMQVNLIAFKCPIPKSKYKVIFNMQLIAPDPILYDDLEDDLIATVARRVGGGYPTPYVLPIAWNPATQPTNIINSGNISIKPVVELSGKVSNPVLTNLTTGEYFTVEIETAGSDELIIDFKNRQILLNGGSILALKGSGSTWMSLASGDNLIQLQTDTPDDTAVALYRYRSGSIGV